MALTFTAGADSDHRHLPSVWTTGHQCGRCDRNVHLGAQRRSSRGPYRQFGLARSGLSWRSAARTTAIAGGGTATPTITATLTDDFPHAPGSGDITVTGDRLVAHRRRRPHRLGCGIGDDYGRCADRACGHRQCHRRCDCRRLQRAARSANDVAGADGLGGIVGVQAAGRRPDDSGDQRCQHRYYAACTARCICLRRGGYTYQSTANGISADTTDTFVYTIKDGDGDLSTTTLTIHLSDVTLVGDSQTKTVDEAALDITTTPPDLGHGTVTGSNPSSTAETGDGNALCGNRRDGLRGAGRHGHARPVPPEHERHLHLYADEPRDGSRLRPTTAPNTVNGVEKLQLHGARRQQQHRHRHGHRSM